MSETALPYLLVDDDPTLTRVLARALQRRGIEAITADSAETALEQAHQQAFSRAIVDLKMAHSSGLELLPQLKAVQPELQVVILTGYSSIATTVEAIKRGACNYLCKPCGVDEILAAFGDQETGVSIPDKPPSVDRLEWEHIQRVLNEHEGNISATARALGMHRRTLQRKLQKRPVQR
jgi:two-component system response regulator RegA